ncbi:hypothetical protein M9Y10_015796 [Tritrichomonas musculus]|uniref:Esterase Ig-like N-terminal domain-containing protein n=1 Tax=Tritrichomonas musculus TaxID=1915356 RepID=A0ABR2I4W9_9EUKA
MNHVDEWEQLKDDNEQKKQCCKPISRKAMVILIVSLSIVALAGMTVLIVFVFVFLKDIENIDIVTDLNITLIAEVYPDGQRITAIAINIFDEKGRQEYIIDNSKLTNQCFSVNERNITNIHSSSSLNNPHLSENGKYIIIELDPKDPGAPILYRIDEINFQGRRNVTLHVKQETDIQLLNGDVLLKSSKVYTNNLDINKSVNLIVDDFITQQYTNQADTNQNLTYNLYVPESLRKGSTSLSSDEKYPLILFMHDASVMCNDTRMTLFQGVGATIWATKEEQLKHESFIVAPCFTETIVNDSFMHTGQYSYIVPMLNDLINNRYQNKIDTNRLYTTGQSMGCMASISLMCEYPDFFSSGLFVAGQWDVKIMENLLNQTFWILCSEADMKAPAQNDKAMENLESLGAKISRARWYGNATEEEKRMNVQNILKEGNDKMYVKFVNHTVMPDDIPYNPGDEHMYTWKVAYLIEGVRDWLFNNNLNK